MAKLNRVTVLAPAKLNLALDVVGTLPNGYHDLDMTMQAITLYEKVVLARSSSLNLSLPGSPVAANDSNTAIKAAMASSFSVPFICPCSRAIRKSGKTVCWRVSAHAEAALTPKS